MNSAETVTEKCKISYADKDSHDYDTSLKGTFSYDFKWEGIIKEVTPEFIISRLIETSTNEEDELVFPIAKIPEDDHELIEEGALFNFYVGYANSNGTIKNADFIKFRRKKIDSTDIDDILEKMHQIDFDGILEDH